MGRSDLATLTGTGLPNMYYLRKILGLCTIMLGKGYVLFIVLGLVLVNPMHGFADAWPGASIGAGFGVQAKPERTDLADLALINASGFSYVRYDMSWDKVERRKGIYDWAIYDRFIAHMRSMHLKSLAILDGNNPAYERKVAMLPSENYGYDWAYAAPSDAEAVRAFAAFSAAAVRRYGSSDMLWEIWNEPDGAGSWPPRPDAQAFSSLTEAACRAMRQAAPTVAIAGPAIGRLPDMDSGSNLTFLRTFLESSGPACLNAISVHPYRAAQKPPESAISDYTKVRQFVAAYVRKDEESLPLLDTEWGYSSSEVTPGLQASYALRIRLADLLSGVPLSIIYEWQDSADIAEERERHFGLVSADKKSKPAGELVRATLPLIRDAVVVRRITVSLEKCFVLLLRQPDERYQLLFWLGWAVPKSGDAYEISIDDGSAAGVRSHGISQTPQLVDVSSSTPEVSIAERVGKGH